MIETCGDALALQWGTFRNFDTSENLSAGVNLGTSVFNIRSKIPALLVLLFLVKRKHPFTVLVHLFINVNTEEQRGSSHLHF